MTSSSFVLDVGEPSAGEAEHAALAVAVGVGIVDDAEGGQALRQLHAPRHKDGRLLASFLTGG